MKIQLWGFFEKEAKRKKKKRIVPRRSFTLLPILAMDDRDDAAGYTS